MITPTITLLILSAAMPVAAAGSSLLSGYGGPGEGNQAILGSSLLNGGGGPKNGGGGTANGGGSTGTGASSTIGVRGQAVRGGKGSPASRHASRAQGQGKQGTGRAGAASGGTAQVYPVSAPGAGAGGSETLGISGEDITYVLLALCGLVFTGLLTRSLARTSAAGRHGR
jgi:hypothetical protein